MRMRGKENGYKTENIVRVLTIHYRAISIINLLLYIWSTRRYFICSVSVAAQESVQKPPQNPLQKTNEEQRQESLESWLFYCESYPLGKLNLVLINTYSDRFECTCIWLVYPHEASVRGEVERIMLRNCIYDHNG